MTDEPVVNCMACLVSPWVDWWTMHGAMHQFSVVRVTTNRVTHAAYRGKITGMTYLACQQPRFRD